MNINYTMYPAVIRYIRTSNITDSDYGWEFNLLNFKYSSIRVRHSDGERQEITCNISNDDLAIILPYISLANIEAFAIESADELSNLDFGSYDDEIHEECLCLDNNGKLLYSFDCCFYCDNSPFSVLLDYIKRRYPELDI